MENLQAINKEKKLQLIIEHDEKVGFYLLIYPLGFDKSIADYLCDSLEDAFFEANERYGIKREDWKKI
jgi:hypothetical protein